MLIVELIHAFGNAINAYDFNRRNTNWVFTHTHFVPKVFQHPGEVTDDVHHRLGPCECCPQSLHDHLGDNLLHQLKAGVWKAIK